MLVFAGFQAYGCRSHGLADLNLSASVSTPSSARGLAAVSVLDKRPGVSPAGFIERELGGIDQSLRSNQ
jgi:hypothetical protein